MRVEPSRRLPSKASGLQMLLWLHNSIMRKPPSVKKAIHLVSCPQSIGYSSLTTSQVHSRPWNLSEAKPTDDYIELGESNHLVMATLAVKNLEGEVGGCIKQLRSLKPPHQRIIFLGRSTCPDEKSYDARFGKNASGPFHGISDILGEQSPTSA